MDKEIVGALIAAASGVTGAIIGFLATYFTKVRELKMIAEQKEDEGWFEELSRRKESVYIPLIAAINKLIGQHEEFIELKLSISQNAPAEGAFEQLEAGAYKFKDACRECVTRITDVWDQGVNIFLTDELEWILKEFKDFLRHAEVNHISFSRSSDFSIFVEQGYLFTDNKIPIISPIFDKRLKNYENLFRSLFRAVVLGPAFRYYQNSIKKQIEDTTKKQTKQPYFWLDHL